MNAQGITKLTILDNDSANTFINHIYNHFKTILNQYSITITLFNELANIFIHHQNEYIKNITEAYESFKQTHSDGGTIGHKSDDLLKTSPLSKKESAMLPFPDESGCENYIYEQFTHSQDSHKYLIQYNKLYSKLMDDTFDRIVRECKLVKNPHKTKYTYNKIIQSKNWELNEIYNNIAKIFYRFTNLDI